MGFKKYDGSVWQPINPKQLKGIPYTGTLPATLTGTKAGYLHRYKIYGNTEQASGTPTPENPIVPSECGERTENLLNFADLIAAPEGMIKSVTFPHVLEITLKPNTTYTMYANGYGSSEGTADTTRSLYFDGTDNNINCVYVNHPSTKTTGSTGVVKIGFMSQRTNAQQYINNTAQTWLTEGSTPLPYIPYGYKIPLLSGSTPVDIYLGDDTLSTEEYVDSGTGKIYRIVSGVLTPVDPPVPFPQIPTAANSTTISWGGQGVAPSEFDSIQEWVDIPTYKRVNGEWVEDN